MHKHGCTTCNTRPCILKLSMLYDDMMTYGCSDPGRPGAMAVQARREGGITVL